MKPLKTILQVEDDLNDLILLKHALRKVGVEWHLGVATDGKQAVNYLQGNGAYADREKHPMPDLILLDLKLPRMMGLEVLQWIREEFGSRVVVVVLTSSALESDIDKAYALGANAFLVKPGDHQTLQSMLKTTCEFWFGINTQAPEITKRSAMEGVECLDRFGRPCELFSADCGQTGEERETSRSTVGFSI
jgi:CheY-like chemotaxis protein